MKFIQEGLLGYFPPINALSKQKCAMGRVIRKPQYLPFKIFVARLTKINNYLPLFSGSSAAKKIPPKELNNIILHAVPNSWTKKAYLQGWDFEGKSFKETCNICERMNVAEQVYE